MRCEIDVYARGCALWDCCILSLYGVIYGRGEDEDEDESVGKRGRSNNLKESE
jgi:hypothetical protein